MDIRPLQTIRSAAPIICLILSSFITYVVYRGEVAVRPITIFIPLWDWMYSITGLVLASVSCCLSAIFIVRTRRTLLPDSKTLWLTMLLAAAWCLFFNPYAKDTMAQLPLCIMFVLACVYLGIAVFRVASYGIWFFVILLSLIQYGADSQGLLLSWTNLMQVFSTTWGDARPYLSAYNVSLILGAIAVSFGAYHVMYRVIRKNTSLSSCFFTGAFLLVSFFVCVKPLQRHLATGSRYIWPIGTSEVLLSNSGRAIMNLARVNKMLKFLPERSAAQAHSDIDFSDKDKPIFILHIGESVRNDHMSLFGYERKTTPFLDSLEQLVSFSDCTSSATSTDKALMVLLTNGRRDFITTKDERYYPSSPSLGDFFDECHFRCSTYWVVDTITGPPRSFCTQEAKFFTRSIPDNYEYTGIFAEAQLPQIFHTLDSSSDRPQFLLVMNRGSHAYFDGFNQEDPPFKPVRIPQPHDEPLTNPEHAENFRNAYDNTIHYTDQYIKKLFEHLQGRPFLYIYVSDHGEYVGDEGYFVRGNAPYSVYYKCKACIVPFLVYASPEMENLHPHFKESLAQIRKHQHMSIGHEHLFHTVLGFFGIQTPYYNPELDLCNEKVMPYTGPHPSRDGASAESAH